MRILRGGLEIVVPLVALTVLLGIGQADVWAAVPGYCGGYSGTPTGTLGRGLALGQACRDLYGPQAAPALVRQDALGWVCKVQGQPDKAINVDGMHSACLRQHGSGVQATLIGIGPTDWRCLPSSDVRRAVVPVLLFPRNKVKAAEVPHVSAALQRISLLMAGVKYFYQDRTWVYMRPMNPFVLLTQTSASEWRGMEGGAWTSEWLQSDYHRRIISELDQSGWNNLIHDAHAGLRIGAFVGLGWTPDIPEPQPKRPLSELLFPSAWAMGRSGVPLPISSKGEVFSLPPSVTDASCSPSETAYNAGYERAFYLVGNRLGTIFKLPRTDQYPFQLPFVQGVPTSVLKQSIMWEGNGTKSLLFHFEIMQFIEWAVDHWKY